MACPYYAIMGIMIVNILTTATITVDDKLKICTDFYKYACGPMPIDMLEPWNIKPEEQFKFQRLTELKSVLAEEINPTDNKLTFEAKKAYQTCVENYNRNQARLIPEATVLVKFFRSLYTDSRSIQPPSVWTDIANMEWYYAIPVLVHIRVIRKKRKGKRLVIALKAVENNLFNVRLHPMNNRRSSFFVRLFQMVEQSLGLYNSSVPSLKAQCFAIQNEYVIKQLQDNQDNQYFSRRWHGLYTIETLQQLTNRVLPSCKVSIRTYLVTYTNSINLVKLLQINWRLYIQRRLMSTGIFINERTLIAFDNRKSINMMFNRIEVFCLSSLSETPALRVHILFFLWFMMAQDSTAVIKAEVEKLLIDLRLTQIDSNYHFSRTIDNYCILKYSDENDIPGFSFEAIEASVKSKRHAIGSLYQWTYHFNDLVYGWFQHMNSETTLESLSELHITYNLASDHFVVNAFNARLEMLNLTRDNHYENARMYRIFKRHFQLLSTYNYTNKFAAPSISPYCTKLIYDEVKDQIVLSDLLIKWAYEEDEGSKHQNRLFMALTEILIERLILLEPDVFRRAVVTTRSQSMISMPSTFEECLIHRYENFVYPYFTTRRINARESLKQIVSDTISAKLFTVWYNKAENCAKLRSEKRLQKYFNDTMKSLCQMEILIPMSLNADVLGPGHIDYDARMNAMFSNIDDFANAYSCSPNDLMNIKSSKCAFIYK